MPCCRRYADRANTYVRTYHATTGHTRPPRTQTSAALRQDGPPPPTPPPHPRLWASSSASASSKLQAAEPERLARSASRGRDGEGGNSVSAIVCAIRVRAVAGEGILACHSESKESWPASSACEISSSFPEHKDKIDSGQSNDRSKARENRKTPRGRKNGGRAWWSRRQREARILAAFKDYTQHWCRFSDPRGMDPRIFLLWKKRIRLRFLALQAR